MNEQQEQEAQDLYQDHLDRMAEEHVLREGYDPKQRADEVTIALADAIFHKHGNYPAALIDACTAIVAIHGEKIASDLVEVIYRDKAEEATSPF